MADTVAMVDTESQPPSRFTSASQYLTCAAMAGQDEIPDNAQRLRAARHAVGLTQAELGEKLKPSQTKQQIYKLEVGKHKIKPDMATQLARVLKVEAASLVDEDYLVSDGALKGGKILSIPVRQVSVRGVAQAGYWAEAELHAHGYDPDTGESYQNTIPVVPYEQYEASEQYAVELAGTSLNRVAPPGSFVICVRLSAFPGGDDLKVLTGRLVHVERRRGDLVETTIKRLQLDARRAELWPDSDDPSHKAPVALSVENAETSVQIVGVVVGLFRTL